ncbi:hypothetical protein OIU84_024665 [Salix udensis]|uniref:Zinc transporter 11 n=1 Tax=Salix udensis TaxID=889485 RepID=A0AAD6PBT4_9ROSI|nr:hypothetical protein OIU84_024665 [Salix udensis]
MQYKVLQSQLCLFCSITTLCPRFVDKCKSFFSLGYVLELSIISCPMSRSLVFLSLFLSLLLLTAGHSGHNDDDEAEADGKKIDLRSKSLILVKIWCLLLIFIGTFIAGVSPYFLKWKEGFLVLGTQFASGVFLATALMHFLSDANETFEDLTSKKYPFAFMLACAGYLLTMLADSIISHVYSKDVVSQVNGDDVELQGGVVQGKRSHSSISHSHFQMHNGTDGASAKPTLSTASSLGDSILLIFALCFHSVFEGIAIGVAETEADAWRALWTITLHKIFAAIAMGIALLRMIPDRPVCIVRCLCFRIRHFKSNRCGHWDHHRCRDSGCCGRLDLCHINGSGVWRVHLRIDQASFNQGLLSPEASFS